MPERDVLFPTGAGLNRDERILVEGDGILIPTCQKIYYGLPGCGIFHEYPFELYKKYQKKQLTPMEVFENFGWFNTSDLLDFLNDGIELTPDDKYFILSYCSENWNYGNALQLDMNVAIAKILKESFIKGVDIIFPVLPHDKDILYLQDTLNPSDTKEIADKIHIILPDYGVSETEPISQILTEMASNSIESHYTTVITSEYNVVLHALQNYNEFFCEDTLFILRNHIGNVISYQGEDGNIHFQEKGTQEIIDIINPNQNRLIDDLPLPLRAKFARFVPKPFIHQKYIDLED